MKFLKIIVFFQMCFFTRTAETSVHAVIGPRLIYDLRFRPQYLNTYSYHAAQTQRTALYYWIWTKR